MVHALQGKGHLVWVWHSRFQKIHMWHTIPPEWKPKWLLWCGVACWRYITSLGRVIWCGWNLRIVRFTNNIIAKKTFAVINKFWKLVAVYAISRLDLCCELDHWTQWTTAPTFFHYHETHESKLHILAGTGLDGSIMIITETPHALSLVYSVQTWQSSNPVDQCYTAVASTHPRTARYTTKLAICGGDQYCDLYNMSNSVQAIQKP